jgi:hypothetical protein
MMRLASLRRAAWLNDRHRSRHQVHLFLDVFEPRAWPFVLPIALALYARSAAKIWYRQR